MRRFHRGMTVLDRQKLREEIMADELRRAVARAARKNLSHFCQYAADVTDTTEAGPGARARLHGRCREEEYDGQGCLCPCHDVRETDVVSGNATAVP